MCRAVHRPKRNHMLAGPAVAHDSHGLDGQKHGKGQPHLTVPAAGLHLFQHKGILIQARECRLR